MKNGDKTSQIRFLKHLLSLLLLLLPANSLADSGKLTVALHGTLGFDGGWVFDMRHDGPNTMPANLFKNEGDYALTMGVGSFVDYRLSENLALGIDVHFLWWNMADRDSILDSNGRLEIGPSVRFGFEPVKHLFIYLRFSPGMTIVLYIDDPVTYKVTDIGYNIALFGGATYRFTENLGVMLEIGAIFHMFFGELPEIDYTHYGFQPHLNCGWYLDF